RQEQGFLNERENFFHKPQVNLNWFSSLTETLDLSTVAYYSGGRGGGTGTYGSLVWDYSGPSRVADWDATIARNASEPGQVSRGILRNSRNNQWTLGAITKLQNQFTPELRVELGLDWRTATIDHYREVRDLLGGTSFTNTSSDFWTTAEQSRGLGDKIAYDNTNQVGWLGGHLQAEYSTSGFTFFGMGGVSTISYTFTDHFTDDGTGNELRLESGTITGMQIKGGGLYNVSDQVGVFLNAGYMSKVPIFDGVIDDNNGILNPDPQNEKILAFELGLNYMSLDRSIRLGLNAYYTQWNDRTRVRNILDNNGNDALISLLGLDALHSGIEAEASFRLSNLLRLDFSAGLNDWRYTDDASGTFRPDARDAATVPYDFYVRDLKVGDAPQRQASLAVSAFPVEGLFLQLVGRTYGRHFSAFDPFGRTDETDRAQSWQVPGYSVLDGHFAYTLPQSFRFAQRTRVFAHVYNILDEVYIIDATDNSRFNGFDGDHDADDAEVHFGLQRRFNVGLQVNF
ncbi:MAG: TonB-dependent receptor, partial [Gemmatimonadales bacterium]